MTSLRILIWNANGISEKAPELEFVVPMNEIILLHNFTPRIFIYQLYTSSTLQRARVRAGVAVLVKNELMHYLLVTIANSSF